MKRTTLIAATGGAVVVLAATGAAIGVAASGPSASPRDASSRTASLVADSTMSSSPPSPAAVGGQRVSLEQAAEIALDRAGGGKVTEIEAEREHGRPVWEVELVAGGVRVEVYVDRETGAVVKIERKAPEVRDRHEGKAGDRGDNSGPGSDDHSGRDHPEDD